METTAASHIEALLTSHNTPKTSEDHERKEQAKGRLGAFHAFIEARGTRYRNCRLANFEIRSEKHRRAVEAIRAYCENAKDNFATGRNLVLFGPCGTGKDHLLTAAVAECIRTDVLRSAPNFEHGSGLFSRSRDQLDNELEFRRQYKSYRLLILSDLCQTGSVLTEFQRQTVYDIIDSRYWFCRPTWMTTNAASREEFANMFGDAITRRLLDESTVVPCVWEAFAGNRN